MNPDLGFKIACFPWIYGQSTGHHGTSFRVGQYTLIVNCTTSTARKMHRKCTEHFWSTISPDSLYSIEYGSSVTVLCGILCRALWLHTHSTPPFLIFCTFSVLKYGIFSVSRFQLRVIIF